MTLMSISALTTVERALGRRTCAEPGVAASCRRDISTDMPNRPFSDRNPTSFTAAGVAARVSAGAPQRAKGATWATGHVFFCDETGNSGSRFYMLDQPIYAEGGWIVPHQERAQAEAAIRDLEQKHKLTAKTKGAALKTSPRGRAYMLEVFDVLRHVAVPFVYLIEKRYFVCSKAVESYFDPVYNPVVDPKETWSPGARQARAEKFYAGPEELIAAFAEAYRSENGAAIATVGARWVEWFDAQGDTKTAAELKVALPTIATHIEQEFSSLHDGGLPRGFDSMNMPALVQVFQLVEQNVPPCDLLHDECATFEAVYRHVYHQQRDAVPSAVVMDDGRKQVYGYERLNSLSFGNSEEQPLLRAADYLTASCADFARRSSVGEDVPLDLAKLAYPGLGAIMVWALSHKLPESERMPQLGQMLASERFIGRTFGQLHKMMHPPSVGG
jgi:hypothetical protein